MAIPAAPANARADEDADDVENLFVGFFEAIERDDSPEGRILRDFYRAQRERIADDAFREEASSSIILVGFNHVLDYDENLADRIFREYFRFAPALDEAASRSFRQLYEQRLLELDRPDDSPLLQNVAVQVSLCDIPFKNALRDITANQVGMLVSFSGTVTRTSAVRPELRFGRFVCLDCGELSKNVEQQFCYTEPLKCTNDACLNTKRWHLDAAGSQFGDWQKLRVQEDASEVPPGALPRTMDVICRGGVVERCRPGDRCVVSGTPLAAPDVSQLLASSARVELRRQAPGAVQQAAAADMGRGVRGVKELGTVRSLTFRLVFSACHVHPLSGGGGFAGGGGGDGDGEGVDGHGGEAGAEMEGTFGASAVECAAEWGAVVRLAQRHASRTEEAVKEASVAAAVAHEAAERGRLRAARYGMTADEVEANVDIDLFDLSDSGSASDSEPEPRRPPGASGDDEGEGAEAALSPAEAAAARVRRRMVARRERQVQREERAAELRERAEALEEEYAAALVTLDRVGGVVAASVGARERGEGAAVRAGGGRVEVGAVAALAASDRQRADALRRQGRILDRLVDQVAPNIYGHRDVKLGILLMLLGGVPKTTPEGVQLRGDINVCIVGDPATAKSQFLKATADSAPRAVYTSGRGSTACGLTASVVRDTESGEFGIEAGALMLADHGVCCIDEFDKMPTHDVVAIHEAMEQQTISIAKVGIKASLNARCSVLAAANPVGGTYDVRKPLRANVAMTAPILSRFDLFFVVVDDPGAASDARLAEHMLTFHRYAHDPYALVVALTELRQAQRAATQTGGDGSRAAAPAIAPLVPADFRLYVRVASQLQPRLSEEAAQLLVRNYVTLRAADRDASGTAYRVTTRQLESFTRLAEAAAKLDLSDVVRAEHVRLARQLLLASFTRLDKGSVALRGEGGGGDSGGSAAVGEGFGGDGEAVVVAGGATDQRSGGGGGRVSISANDLQRAKAVLHGALSSAEREGSGRITVRDAVTMLVEDAALSSSADMDVMAVAADKALAVVRHLSDPERGYLILLGDGPDAVLRLHPSVPRD